MRQLLARFGKDIWNGKNIDAYVAIVVALFAALLEPFGWVSGDALTSITLAMFALLAVSLLISRHRLTDLTEAMEPAERWGFLREFDEGAIDRELQRAKEIWFYGASLGGFANSRFALIEGRLKEGCSIRVLVIDPNSTDVLQMSEKRAYGNPSVDRARSKVFATLDDFGKIRDRTGGDLQIRTIQYPLPHRLVAVDPKGSEGKLYISEYLFQTPDGSVPRFVLNTNQEYWYRLYLTEAQSLWDDGSDWTIPTPATS